MPSKIRLHIYAWTLIPALKPSKRTDSTSLVCAGIWSRVDVLFRKINAYTKIRTAFSYGCRLQVGLTGLELFVYWPFTINHNSYAFSRHLSVINRYSWPTSDAPSVTFVSPLLINAMDIADRCINQPVRSIPPPVELLSIDRLTTNILAPWRADEHIWAQWYAPTPFQRTTCGAKQLRPKSTS
jgi:hypothetical protein